MSDRRRHARYGVTWPMRLWINRTSSLIGRVVNASVEGMRVALVNWVPSEVFQPGQTYRLDVRPDASGAFTCVAEIRGINHYGISLEVKATLRRILVVDDDPLLVELLSDYFTSEGYSVMPAATAAAALAAVREVRPDVVLLDIGLPDGDGFDVLRHIRQYDPTIGVVMLTGQRDVGLARASIQMGAIDCVFKPIDLDRIGRAVEIGLGQEAQSEAALASSLLSAASPARASLSPLAAATADDGTQPVS